MPPAKNANKKNSGNDIQSPALPLGESSPRKVTVSSFGGLVYIHINNLARKKSVSLNVDEYYDLLYKKHPIIQHWIEYLSVHPDLQGESEPPVLENVYAQQPQYSSVQAPPPPPPAGFPVAHRYEYVPPMGKQDARVNTDQHLYPPTAVASQVPGGQQYQYTTAGGGGVYPGASGGGVYPAAAAAAAGGVYPVAGAAGGVQYQW
jgi:hypothetical protein